MAPQFGVSTGLLQTAAGDLRRRTVDFAEDRAEIKWQTVDEGGSSVVASAVSELADWYLVTWARLKEDLVGLADAAAAVAVEYERTEQTVTDENRIEIF